MIRKLIPQFIKRGIGRILFYKKNKPVIDALKTSAGKKRSILFLTPTHGNIGDQAITYVELQFLRDVFGEHMIIEISDDCWAYEKKNILRYIRKDECLFIHGGGFMGTLWFYFELQFREIIKAFPRNKIVVFPQSVFFSNDQFGKEQVNQSKRTYSQHMQLYICVREKNSYECVEKNCLIPSMDHCFLMPDIVTYYKGDFSGYKRSGGVLLCLRHDKEKVIGMDLENEIVNVLSSSGFEISYTDTVVPYRISEYMREREILKKLQEFAQCRFVITDRLHGMLLAAVSATPCLFMDNCSKKVSGTYEWIQNLEYIKPLKDMDSLKAFIRQLDRGQTYCYTNEQLQGYYDKLAEIIRNDVISK